LKQLLQRFHNLGNVMKYNLMFRAVQNNKTARGEVRTHEAYTVDLKTTPFDHSGTLAIRFYFRGHPIYRNIKSINKLFCLRLFLFDM
jgi:hypothetical protein